MFLLLDETHGFRQITGYARLYEHTRQNLLRNLSLGSYSTLQ
jgi:hypothetical protein